MEQQDLHLLPMNELEVMAVAWTIADQDGFILLRLKIKTKHPSCLVKLKPSGSIDCQYNFPV